MKNIYLLLIVVFVNIVFSAPSENAKQLVNAMIKIRLSKDGTTIEKRFDEYITQSGLKKENVACSLFVIMKDIEVNQDEWKKAIPKYYGLEGTILAVLVNIKYEPIREYLLEKMRTLKCTSQMMIHYSIFYISKENWFNIFDSIISDTNTYCDNTRYFLFHNTIPEMFFTDTTFMSNKKDSIFKALINGLLFENDPNEILFIDSLCTILSPNDYKLSLERMTFLEETLETQRVKNRILQYHPLKQEKIKERIKKFKKSLSEKTGLKSSPLVKQCFDKRIKY